MENKELFENLGQYAPEILQGRLNYLKKQITAIENELEERKNRREEELWTQVIEAIRNYTDFTGKPIEVDCGTIDLKYIDVNRMGYLETKEY